MPRKTRMEFVDLVGFWKEKVGEILLNRALPNGHRPALAFG